MRSTSVQSATSLIRTSNKGPRRTEELVGPVAERKDDVVELVELAALAESGFLLLEEVGHGYGVVGRFAFAVGGDDEDGELVGRELVEVFEIVPAPGVLAKEHARWERAQKGGGAHSSGSATRELMPNRALASLAIRVA